MKVKDQEFCVEATALMQTYVAAVPSRTVSMEISLGLLFLVKGYSSRSSIFPAQRCRGCHLLRCNGPEGFSGCFKFH